MMLRMRGGKKEVVKYRYEDDGLLSLVQLRKGACTLHGTFFLVTCSYHLLLRDAPVTQSYFFSLASTTNHAHQQ